MTILPIGRTYLAVAALCVFSAMSPAAAVEPNSDVSLNLDVYRGNVVVIDFWASWCVPCRRSFPWLNSMHDKYGTEGLVIIGVNVDKERAEAMEFLREYPANFRIHYDPEGALARDYDVQGMPSSFVIGRNGRVTIRHLGFKVKKQQEYEAAIVAALGEGLE